MKVFVVYARERGVFLGVYSKGDMIFFPFEDYSIILSNTDYAEFSSLKKKQKKEYRIRLNQRNRKSRPIKFPFNYSGLRSSIL